jgi:hypothetical protein
MRRFPLPDKRTPEPELAEEEAPTRPSDKMIRRPSDKAIRRHADK